jgi:ribose transport system permease protein
MSAVGSVVRRIASDGSTRAAFILLVFFLIWAINARNPLESKDITDWLVLALPLAVASIGVTLVIITKQFDLSAAGVITLTSVMMATSFKETNVWIVVILVLAVGALVGLLNGVFVVFAKLPAIAVTLATLIILQGVSLILLVRPGGSVDENLISFVTGSSESSSSAFFPRPALILLVLVAAWLLFKRTKLGIYMYAVGRDEEAVQLSGVSVRKVRLSIFTIAGILYALAGVFLAAAIKSGDATIGESYVLSTFAAIAIGGTAFIGGSGSAIGTIFGALTLMVMPKMLFVIGISGWSARVFTGVLIILAVLAGAVSAMRQGAKLKETTGEIDQTDADQWVERNGH